MKFRSKIKNKGNTGLGNGRCGGGIGKRKKRPTKSTRTPGEHWIPVEIDEDQQRLVEISSDH